MYHFLSFGKEDSPIAVPKLTGSKPTDKMSCLFAYMRRGQAWNSSLSNKLARFYLAFASLSVSLASTTKIRP